MFDSNQIHVRADQRLASRLWNSVLHRQGIGTGKKFASAHAAARASLGLHSARLESPLATLIARTDAAVNRRDLVTPLDQSLLTLRCMRKTLHALPVDVASAAHGATRRYRLRDALRLAHNAMMDSHELQTLCDKITSLLANGSELHFREIEQHVTPTSASPTPARVALKYLWESGEVAYRNRSPAWDSERRHFSLMRCSYPDFDKSMDETQAVRQLMAEYFSRYGPASVRDAAWWSGLAPGRVQQAIAVLPLIAVQTPWTVNPCYMFESEYARFASSIDTYMNTGVCILAHEDVALKAYYETRGRYLGHHPQTAIYNQIGEVLPTILHNGKAIGRWRWQTTTQTVDTWFINQTVSQTIQRDVARHAAELQCRLRNDSRHFRAPRTPNP